MSDQKNTLHDNALGWCILGVIFFLLLLLIWHFFSTPIKDTVRWIRWGQIWAISQVVPSDYSVVKVANGEPVELNIDAAVTQVKELKPEELTSSMVGVISYIAMKPLLWPFTGLIGAMGLWALMYGPRTQYRRKLDLDGLIRAQAGNFPAISPFVTFNPSTISPRPPGAPVPAELPIFAEALGPEEWLAYNEIPIPDGKLDQDVAYAAFAQQLGPRWQGVANLAPYKQVLLAACCLRAARKRRESDELLGRVSKCWHPEKGLQLGQDGSLLKDARAALRDKKIAGNTVGKCNQHGFQTTAMLRALQTAREEGGVLAPAQFLWLRAHDRHLWYALNNLGRQAYHMEALGSMAHFKAEKLAQRPIPRPKIMDAVSTLESYVSSSKLRPIPPLDYSQSKKRGVKKPVQPAAAKGAAKGAAGKAGGKAPARKAVPAGAGQKRAKKRA